MKKLFLLSLVVGISSMVSAQRAYYLYLQTDNQAPFYIRMADKIYSSAASGFLIIPNLTDSTYKVYLGFPKTTQAETKFAVTIHQKDKGYLVKNFDDGIGLFDMQDMSVVKAETAATSAVVYETKTDKFSSILSKAADDPSLLKVPVAKKEEPKVEPMKEETVTAKADEKKEVEKKEPEIKQPEKGEQAAAPVVIADVKAESKEEPKKEPSKPEETAAQTVTPPVEEPKKEEVKEVVASSSEPVTSYKRSKVSRRSESSTTEGFGVVYHDKMKGHTDTIRILIPPSRVKIDDDVQTANLSEIEKRNNNVQGETPQVQVQDVEEPKKEETKKSETKKEEPGKEVAASPNSACKSEASEKDFHKLRKNMASETNDEEMIDVAKKSFKSKCYSTEQIRYLSTLFLTSAAKYQFFDASYNHVSDKTNFSSLQSEIKDEYYLKRFKALIGE
jgi:hypothetical protein